MRTRIRRTAEHSLASYGAREIELERKTRKLEKKLAKAEAVIEFQKKVHELLGIPLKSHELDEDD
ncbi:MAG: hypothetical protein IPJ19_01815 [Planctomycetes bacterium]|nr:hypothetical protein [Planctomycetota bacterium]